MNLFERLYRYREKAGKHERENYLTELLAVVLEHYPPLITRLCEHAKLTVPAGSSFRVRTQVSYAHGQPDIVLESVAGDIFLLIECKLEAGEGHEQLKRYQRIVQAENATQRGIIFLTKYYESPDDPLVAPLRWYQLFSFLIPLSAGELLTLFRDYLIYHRLHKPMNFLAADLIALEQMQATITKMDEVLNPLEWEFRKYLGGTGQYTKTRSAKLAEGWYGYWRYIGTACFSAGFQCSPGEIPWCFIEVESWNCAPIPTQDGPEANRFQQALRTVWSITAEKLSYLAVTKPVTSFMSAEDDGVVAMRNWFSTHFAQLNTTLEQHEYFWKGVPEVAAAPDETIEI